MKMKRFELWYSKNTCSYDFFEKDHPQKHSLLEDDAVLIWSVEAASYDEAQVKKHEYLGWEPYNPMD